MADDAPRTPDEVKDAARVARRERSPIDQLNETAAKDYAQDVRLKGQYAVWFLWAMLGQIAVADTVFVLYAWLGVAWKISAPVIEIWLAATVIEIIGIVLVITRYLFPRRDL